MARHDLSVHGEGRRVDIDADPDPPLLYVLRVVSSTHPALRRRDELIAIVARIHQRGLRAPLFTDGIKATRELLTELAQAGLTDVVFHVDLTQQRAGYASRTT